MLNRETEVLLLVALMEALRSFAVLLKKRKRDVFLVALWTIVVTLMIIRTHQQFYIDHPEIAYYQIGFLTYAGPTFSGLDVVLILLVSAVVSTFLISVRSVIFGYFASLFLGCSIGVVYMFLYNWFVLELGVPFSELPYGWEWVLFMGIINVFRYIFPLGITFSLVGVGVGGVIKMLTNR